MNPESKPDCERASTTFSSNEDELFIRGGQFIGRVQELIRVIDGPMPGIHAMVPGKKGPVVASVKIDEPVREQCAIYFWMRSDTYYRNGEEQSRIERQLIEIPGIGECIFRQAPANCSLIWKWQEPTVNGVDNMSISFTELPGPEWYHLLYTWDAKRGLFDAYVNGVPQRLPCTQLKPWSMKTLEEFYIHIGPFRFSKLTIEPKYLSPKEAQTRVPKEYNGRHEFLFGRGCKHKSLDVENRLGKKLYESTLDSKKSVEGWVLEGPGILEFKNSWMQMSSKRPEGPNGHIVYWCPMEFPDAFVAEWKMQRLSKYGLCIVFFAAKGENGEDIFDPKLPPRNGIFSEYTTGAIVSYHISYYANTPFNPGRITSNMRKNNNFYLVANGPPGILPTSTKPHQIRLLKDRKHMQFLVDNQVIIDFVDDGKRYGPVHGDGKIGLRQMQWMKAQYRDFCVWELGN